LVRGLFAAGLNFYRVPALHHGRIVPSYARAFNKSRRIPAMIILAAARWMRRKVSLRGGRRAEGSSDQHAMSRHPRLAPAGLADMPLSLNQRGKS
jgi:hypothetical protein